MLSTEAKDWQWWKLEFVSNDTKPVIQNKVTEDIVLKAASNDSATALLVYASEAAVSYQSEDLPQQLHNFIRADNLIFSKELEGSGHPQSATPIKRKVHHQHDSDDLEDHPQRSPPHDRSLVGAVISNEDLDPNPPGYNANPSPPPILSHHQNNTHQVGNTRSFDDIIPASLQGGEPTNNHNESLPDQARMSDGHEMQERGRGQGFLSQVKGQRDQYAFSSYVPEIDMEDDEDEDQRLARCD